MIEIGTKTGLTEAESELIRSRNRFVDDRKRDGQLYRRRDPFHTLVLRALEVALIAESKLQGRENLDFAVNRIGKGRMTFAGNHTSDADHPALENVLLQNGYESIAERLLFPAGLKMWDRPQTGWAMDGMNAFPTAAPGYYADIEEITKRTLSDKERSMIEAYKANLDWLNLASFKAILPDWRDGQAIVVVYPESTRSRSRFIERGREETESYFRHSLVLPFMIEGPQDAFPPEQDPNWELLLDRFKLGKGWLVSVMFGAPIAGAILNAPRTKAWLKERGATPVDFVVSRIVALKPERANPKDRPLYTSLGDSIPEGLIIKTS